MKKKPIVGITLGDAAGIGPEITIKSIADGTLHELCLPLLIGDPLIVEETLKLVGVNLAFKEVKGPEECKGIRNIIEILPVKSRITLPIEYGKVDATFGEASVQQSMIAAKLALEGKIDAICSAPVNKEAMRLAGYLYEGQTQLFGEFCKAKKWGMLLLFGPIRCYMLTNHLSLRDAIKKVTYEFLIDALELVAGSLSLFTQGRKPVIAISALNPHAGENGLFGREEIEQILPAIEWANQHLTSAKVLGPIPSDTIFIRAKEGEFDAVISLFHDQANMAMKLIGFGEVVTFILGLPIIRTSVGHGTAFDIAGQNKANYRNMYAAIRTAAELATIKIGVAK